MVRTTGGVGTISDGSVDGDVGVSIRSVVTDTGVGHVGFDGSHIFSLVCFPVTMTKATWGGRVHFILSFQVTAHH